MKGKFLLSIFQFKCLSIISKTNSHFDIVAQCYVYGFIRLLIGNEFLSICRSISLRSKPGQWSLYTFINRCYVFSGIVIIWYITQVTSLAFKENSREVGVERNPRIVRDQRSSRDSRELREPREPRDPREPIDNRENREPLESRDQKDDDKERDRDDREEPEDDRDFKERKDSKEAREPREFKELRDLRDARDSRDLKQKKEMTTPDIDEFLEKILKSDKIKQIADLIAEKAADKILSESKTREVLRFNANNKEKDVEKESVEKDKHVDEFDDDEALRKDKIPKIDAKVAMKKVSKFPDGDVSLNYKHFIADGVYTKESNSNIKHHSQRLDEAKDENRDKYSKKPDKKSDLRSGPKFKESGETESSEHKRHEKHALRSESQQRSGKKRILKQRAASEDESFESAGPVSPKEMADNSKEETYVITSAKAIKPNVPVKNLKKLHSASKSYNTSLTETDTSDSDSNKVPIADVHSRGLPSRTMIRNEAGKLYAFAPSRDYDDYHEKLSSLLKSVQDKTIRKLEKRPSYKET